MGEERGQLWVNCGTDKFHSAVSELINKCEVISWVHWGSSSGYYTVDGSRSGLSETLCAWSRAGLKICGCEVLQLQFYLSSLLDQVSPDKQIRWSTRHSLACEQHQGLSGVDSIPMSWLQIENKYDFRRWQVGDSKSMYLSRLQIKNLQSWETHCKNVILLKA